MRDETGHQDGRPHPERGVRALANQEAEEVSEDSPRIDGKSPALVPEPAVPAPDHGMAPEVCKRG